MVESKRDMLVKQQNEFLDEFVEYFDMTLLKKAAGSVEEYVVNYVNVIWD